jgi:acetyl esterase
VTLDPYLLEQLQAAAKYPPLSKTPVAKVRATDVRRNRTGLPLAEVHQIQDLDIPGPHGALRLRLYWPSAIDIATPLPITVFFHGSGFVICSIESHEEICRHLCRGSGSLIVSVDYALAPEHPFPAALDDCVAAVRGIASRARSWGADPDRLAVAGDSAGANLATVTALRLRDEGGEPSLRAQVLWYPVVDHYSANHASYLERGSGFGLTSDDMRWFWDQYVDPRGANNPYLSPLRAQTLQGLPPAFVVTADYDVLRDEGRAYAERLRASGVPTDVHHYEDANHGFLFWVGRMPSADAAMQATCTWLRAALR